MIKPTPEEVTRYAYKIGFILNGEEFCDYYESKGWLVGKTPMKVWQAAVRTWKAKQARDDRFKRPTQSQSLLNEEGIKLGRQKVQDLMSREWEKKEAIRQAALRDQMRTNRMEDSYGQ